MSNCAAITNTLKQSKVSLTHYPGCVVLLLCNAITAAVWKLISAGLFLIQRNSKKGRISFFFKSHKNSARITVVFIGHVVLSLGPRNCDFVIEAAKNVSMHVTSFITKGELRLAAVMLGSKFWVAFVNVPVTIRLERKCKERNSFHLYTATHSPSKLLLLLSYSPAQEPICIGLL